MTIRRSSQQTQSTSPFIRSTNNRNQSLWSITMLRFAVSKALAGPISSRSFATTSRRVRVDVTCAASWHITDFELEGLDDYSDLARRLVAKAKREGCTLQCTNEFTDHASAAFKVHGEALHIHEVAELIRACKYQFCGYTTALPEPPF